MNLFNRKELPKEDIVVDEAAQELVQQWLTDTLQRQIFTGHEVSNRLKRISETLPASEQLAQDYIRTWLMEITLDLSYRSSETQNQLLELWAYISHYESGSTEEFLSPSV